MRRTAAFAWALFLWGWQSALPAHAWTFREHEEVGSLAFVQACKELRARFVEDEDAGRVERLRVACDNVDVNALLYGKANGTAGDRISDPEEFMSSMGGFRATSRFHYLRLKLVNSTHFHPQTARQWQKFHRNAIAKAIAASKVQGVDQVAALEAAVYENAFADHFLQDAFCSGHMGFNRSASSVAASLVFHDTWNERGRVVRNRNGNSWKTYGDSRLRISENSEARRRIIEATRKSVFGVLLAFVGGERDPDNEVQIWRSLPFTIEAPEVRSPLEQLLADLADRPTSTGLEPLAAINQPARKGLSLEAWSFAAGSRVDDRPAMGVLAGVSNPVPFLAPMVYGAVGASRAGDSDLTRLTLEVGGFRPVALTLDGIMSHDVLVGVNWQVGLQKLRGSVHATYRATFELGRTLVRLQIGPAYHIDTGRIGAYLGVGFGYAVNARGGGSI